MRKRDLIVSVKDVASDNLACRVCLWTKEDVETFLDALQGAGDCDLAVKVESAVVGNSDGVEYVRPDSLNDWFTDIAA